MASNEQLGGKTAGYLARDLFHDSVFEDFGHKVYTVPITNYCDYSEETVSCPRCKAVLRHEIFQVSRKHGDKIKEEKSLNVNQHNSENDPNCDGLKEPLQAIWEEDFNALCVDYGKPNKNQSSKVLAIEEAIEEYKEKLARSLDSLKKQTEANLASTREEETQIGGIQSKVEWQRARIFAEFDRLHQFLNEEQRVLLTKLDNEEKNILKIRNENLKRLSEQSSTLRKLMEEIKRKLRSPDTEIIADTGDILQRCRVACKTTTEDAPRLDINKYCFSVFLWMEMWKNFRPAPAPLTLDPSTAHPELILSKDLTAVMLGDTKQELPDNPERFDFWPAVLSSEGFTSGRYYWEVEVGDGGIWAVGVVLESVRRKGQDSLTTKNGFWTLWQLYGGYWASDTFLPQKEEPRRIGVYLDYDGGQLSFYNADNMSHLYSFDHPFSQKMFPFFYTTTVIKIATSMVIK